jgi:hypothetical protein
MSAQAQVFEGAASFPPANADIEDLRMAWRDAADDARDAYRHWSDAEYGQTRMAYAVYLAAADRETVAADVLATVSGPVPLLR